MISTSRIKRICVSPKKVVLISALLLGLYFFYARVTKTSSFENILYSTHKDPYEIGNDILPSFSVDSPADSPAVGSPADSPAVGSPADSPAVGSPAVDSQILLLSDKSSQSTLKVIKVILQTHRIPYIIHFYSRNSKHQLEEIRMEAGVSRLVGRYCLIICTDMVHLYKNLERSLLLQYLHYAKSYNVTLINFISENTKTTLEDIFATHVLTKDIQGVLLNSSKNFYYLKTDEMVTSIPPNTQWTAIDFAHSKLEVLAEIQHRLTGHDTKHVTSPVVVVADGRKVVGEGFMHVLIGAPISFWLTKLMLLEVIRSYVSSPQPLARFGRKRWLMVDIDDVFRFSSETRMTPQDVQVFYTDTN